MESERRDGRRRPRLPLPTTKPARRIVDSSGGVSPGGLRNASQLDSSRSGEAEGNVEAWTGAGGALERSADAQGRSPSWVGAGSGTLAAAATECIAAAGSAGRSERSERPAAGRR